MSIVVSDVRNFNTQYLQFTFLRKTLELLSSHTETFFSNLTFLNLNIFCDSQRMNGWVDDEGWDSGTQGQQQELSLFGQGLEDLGSLAPWWSCRNEPTVQWLHTRNWNGEVEQGRTSNCREAALISPPHAENSRFYIQSY